MMNVLRRAAVCAGMVALVALAAQPWAARAEAATNAVPEFKEVYDLIRQHLAGESEADLNRDAVRGLLNQLHAKVSLVGAKSTGVVSNEPALGRAVIYNDTIAYLRVQRVGEGLAENLQAALKNLSASNSLTGIVIDLRYAGGDDYAAAVSAANLFISKVKPLLDWGRGIIQSKYNTNAITLPMAVLINHETAAGAEVLAELLRRNDEAIVLGATSAGEATMTQEFSLKDGQTLKIATAAIKLDNGEALSANGINPDIAVFVRPENEQLYYADPFRELGDADSGLVVNAGNSGVSNRVARAHPLTEAELMRERKAKPGVDVDDLPLTPPSAEEAEKPVVHDPVLARALDLVKGIAAIRQAANK